MNTTQRAFTCIDFVSFLKVNADPKASEKALALLGQGSDQEQAIIRAYLYAAVETGDDSLIVAALERLTRHGDMRYFVLEFSQDSKAWAALGVHDLKAHLERCRQIFCGKAPLSVAKEPAPFPEEEYEEIVPANSN